MREEYQPSDCYNKCVNRLIQFWNKYERHLSVLTLLCGFTFDLILAKRPDSIPDNILLLFYLVLSAAIIIVLNRYSVREMKEGEKPVEPLLMLLILQFCFGGLSSNLLILYGKSGSFGGTAIFLGLLVCLLIGNEMLKNRYAQLRFNIAVYYFLLLTYLVIAVPTFVLHTIGIRAFLISGVASLAVMAGVISMLRIFALRHNKRRQLWEMRGIVVGVFLVFNLLYFLNVIPPVPLSLKAAGIYHSISKDDAGDYTATYEKKHWYEFWRDTGDTYHAAAGEPAYCFSAVFAPGSLSAPIMHRWEYFYPTTKHWITTGIVQFPITGGRAEGYRGFSEKQILTDGQWRCTVETTKGQVIGYITFDVQTGSFTQTLQTATL